MEIIEIFDSDDEELPSKGPPLQKKNVGGSSDNQSSELLREYVSWSNPRGGQSQHTSLSGGDIEGSDKDVDGMHIGDETHNLLQSGPVVPAARSAHPIGSDSEIYSDHLSNTPSSPLLVADDTSNNQVNQGLIPLPSSNPSRISSSPKDKHLSTPPAPATSLASLTRLSPLQPPTLTKPISDNNRLGFSSVSVSSSLQAPPPAKRHVMQLARKIGHLKSRPPLNQKAIREEPPEKRGTVETKASKKGKEKEIRQSSSSSGDKSIGLRDALAKDSDKVPKQRPVSSLPKEKECTLAEVITPAGQLNRAKKKTRLRLQGDIEDVPMALTSDAEEGVKDGASVDENKNALKAAFASSKLLVNLLPTLKAKRRDSADVITAAAEGDCITFVSAVPMTQS